MTFDLHKQRKGYMKINYPDAFYLFYNTAILWDIYHEFNHVDQAKITDDYNENNLLFIILTISLPFLNPYDPLFRIKEYIYKRYYDKNWINDPHERIANIISGIHLLDTIENIPKDVFAREQLINTTKLELDEYCLRKYKLQNDMTNSPTIDFIKKIPFGNNRHIFKEEKYYNLFFNPNLSYEEKVLYGLSIDKEDYLSRTYAHDNLVKELNDSMKLLIKVPNKR